MVIKVYPSAADFENLSRVRTIASTHANDFNYSNVVVNKPWGYEYLWYQNPSVAVWMLYLEKSKATSLHSHLRKRTSLIVVSGQVVCSTLEDRHKLSMADSVVLEPCVFHTTQAISDEGAFVIEVETPPMKGDLVRLKDNFGREKSGYEKQSQYSYDLSAYYYQPYNHENEKSLHIFGELCFELHSVQDFDEITRICTSKLLVVPFLGRLANGKNILLETGEAVHPNNLDLSKLPSFFPPVELMVIDNANFER
jgi:mannose-6-phosphate isomerase-like protein (cupin superfamily)